MHNKALVMVLSSAHLHTVITTKGMSAARHVRVSGGCHYKLVTPFLLVIAEGQRAFIVFIVFTFIIYKIHVVNFFNLVMLSSFIYEFYRNFFVKYDKL